MFKGELIDINPAPVAGAKFVVNIPIGPTAPTLDKLKLVMSAGAGTFNSSKIDSIVGKLNGKEFYAEDGITSAGGGALCDLRRAYKGQFVDPSELVIDFTEWKARSAIEQLLTSIPLSQAQKLQFEFKVAGSAGTGLKAKPYMLFRAPTKNPFIKKMFHVVAGFNASGRQDIFVPNGVSGGKLLRIWIHEGIPGNITNIELRAKNAIGYETSRASLENDQKENGLVPQAGVVVVDFIADGNLSGMFDSSSLSDVQLRVTGTAADSYDIFYEYADLINRL